MDGRADPHEMRRNSTVIDGWLPAHQQGRHRNVSEKRVVLLVCCHHRFAGPFRGRPFPREVVVCLLVDGTGRRRDDLLLIASARQQPLGSWGGTVCLLMHFEDSRRGACSFTTVQHHASISTDGPEGSLANVSLALLQLVACEQFKAQRILLAIQCFSPPGLVSSFDPVVQGVRICWPGPVQPSTVQSRLERSPTSMNWQSQSLDMCRPGSGRSALRTGKPQANHRAADWNRKDQRSPPRPDSHGSYKYSVPRYYYLLVAG
ncbi:uncharacterized protein F5Z01DRAFT_298273 [Emericellopsis atlantica]|uniref:Uncharacterized protein n=1 Tax=Emericellopsis atlantica TaxID=2614577 RepID=A0A9P7ZFV2_9HYPO|nr:uncharacterized protein F5Z01DRAFT_298273 [Emericellopsis atlantica]KAG9251171.1 hypothetical protein F5Z01DRAFT_298273 [Emericellopsis atlantica]